MARTLPTALLITASLPLAACGSGGGADTAVPPLDDAATPGGGVDGLAVDALPEVPGGRGSREQCPYLATGWVAETDGQRATWADTDPRFSTPACVFWSYPEQPQLTVIVREMAGAAAVTAVVDWASPRRSPAGPGPRRGGHGVMRRRCTRCSGTTTPWWCSAIRSSPSKRN